MSDADKFKEMAARIEHNAANAFGGAAVIVPPAGGGAPIEFLMLDLSADPAQFWATISTRIKMTLDKVDEHRRQVNLR